MDEKVDVLDLIIQTLKDHEKRMDELIESLEGVAKTLGAPINNSEMPIKNVSEKVFLIGLLDKRIKEEPTNQVAEELRARLFNSLPKSTQTMMETKKTKTETVSEIMAKLQEAITLLIELLRRVAEEDSRST